MSHRGSIMPDIELVTATRSERARLLALIREELADRADMLMRLMGMTWFHFEKLYESRGDVRTLRCDSTVVGYCWVEERDRVLHLHAIFVLRDHRRRGVGSAALASLEKAFRGNVDVIELGVEQDNSEARSLYERQGFTVIKRLEELGFYIMRKPLHGEPHDRDTQQT